MSRRTAWGVVLASFLAMVVSNGPINTFAFGAFLRPVTAELGLTRGMFSSAMGLGLFMTALGIPFFGAAVDRYGYRRVLLVAVPLYVAGIALLSLLPASVPGFYAMFALTGLVSVGLTPNAYSKAVAVWFDRDRGLALGIATAGVGVGTALMPQFAAYLIGSVGWRPAFLWLAGAVAVGAYLPVILLLREPPSLMRGAATVPGSVAVPGLTWEAARRSGRFWAIAVAFLTAGVAIVGTLSQLFPMLADRGFSPAGAANVLSTAGLALILGRVVAGYALDRIFAPYVTAVFFLLALLGIALIAFGGGAGTALAGAVLLGSAIGADFDIVPFLVSRYFGLRAFGRLYGVVFCIFLVGSGLGPTLLGLSFDRAGSYRPMLIAFLPLLAVGGLLLLRLGPYAFPVGRAAPVAAGPVAVAGGTPA